MSKILGQATAIVFIFFALYLGLMQIDWVKILEIDKMSENTEEKLGDLFWDLLSKENQEINGNPARIPVDSILAKLCEENKIKKKEIRLHILKNSQVNAFALPNGHLVIHSALITACENQEELAGVIGHELAHIELKHVMKKLMKEIGLSVLVSMTTGGGGQTAREAAKLLSSSAYDRSLESEADMKSVAYLMAAQINPEPFANFLYRLGDEENESTKYLAWISTHPDSKDRAQQITESISEKKDTKYQSVLSQKTWEKLKAYVEEE